MRRVITVWIVFCILGLLNAIELGFRHAQSDVAQDRGTAPVQTRFLPRSNGAAPPAEHPADEVTRAEVTGLNTGRHASHTSAENGTPVRLVSIVSQSNEYSVTDEELDLLAHAVYGEARGEPYTGQVAVAAVILNRVADPRFPDAVADVIYQPGAFTAVADKQIYLEPDETAYEAAREAVNGADPTGGAIYYYNPARATSDWIWSREVVTVIGRHRFAN